MRRVARDGPLVSVRRAAGDVSCERGGTVQLVVRDAREGVVVALGVVHDPGALAHVLRLHAAQATRRG